MNVTQLEEIYNRLVVRFGKPVLVPDEDPLGGLVATILSQATSDVNSGRAYANLRATFADWPAVRDAETSALAASIHQGGLANIKAARIQAALQYITAQLPASGASDETLDSRFAAWLSNMPITEARLALQKIPSVGPKTAACVLLFSLGLPSMPVDTHVYRITQRLGLVQARTNVNQVHELYDATTPAEMVYPLHVLLITHGRHICRSQHPRCTECPLLDICPYGQHLVYPRE